MQRKTIVFAGGLLLVAAAVALAVTRTGTRVETVTVEPGAITRTVQDTGYVQPVKKYDLYATAGTVGTEAEVVSVPVARGREVTKGQVLVRLRDPNLDAQVSQAGYNLSQAEAGLASAGANLEDTRLAWQQAERDFARAQQLYAAGADTTAQFEQARTALDTARENWQAQNTLSQQAQVDSLKQSLQALDAEEGQLVVTSPADGTVLDLSAQEDQAVAPGTLLVTVAASGGLEVKADILSDDMADVHVGQAATVTAPVLGGTVLTGRVVEIYPQAGIEQSALGELQRRVPVIITLPGTADLEPGYEVQVAIDTASLGNVLVVPREAVRTGPDGRQEVMAVVHGRVQYRVVTTGLADSDNVAITGGLKAGDVVIKDATQDLPENSRVSTGR